MDYRLYYVLLHPFHRLKRKGVFALSQNNKKSGLHMPYSKAGKILLNLLVTALV